MLTKIVVQHQWYTYIPGSSSSDEECVSQSENFPHKTESVTPTILLVAHVRACKGLSGTPIHTRTVYTFPAKLVLVISVGCLMSTMCTYYAKKVRGCSGQHARWAPLLPPPDVGLNRTGQSSQQSTVPLIRAGYTKPRRSAQTLLSDHPERRARSNAATSSA